LWHVAQAVETPLKSRAGGAPPAGADSGGLWHFSQGAAACFGEKNSGNFGCWKLATLKDFTE